MAASLLSDFNTIISIATILAMTVAVGAFYPTIWTYLRRVTGQISDLTSSEASYLSSLIKDLERLAQKTRWSDKFYVNVDTELYEREIHDIPPAFYVVQAINRNLKEQDFNNLTNVEKIDSSRGRTFNSLETALSEAQDNAVVVIAPPGSGKTVSLRNLAIRRAHARLERNTNVIPIFINLAYYTDFNEDGSIKEFDIFLEEFLMRSGYQKYLANKYWERLLTEGQCIFFLDGIDEIPRSPEEYEARSQMIANFVRKWPNTQFILSCRELDYNRDLPFQQILIKPFDHKHIQSYMKRYFQKVDYKDIFRQIEDSTGIYELCANPFYLDLICYFSETKGTIPENKAQLFNFIVTQFVERENQKLTFETIPFSIPDFVLAMSHLAYYLAVERMVTSVGIEEYRQTIQDHPRRDIFSQIIKYAIKGELLEFNKESQQIRFIHNRFQEFFSSFYILINYRANKDVLPENIFTNLWWRETVLFMAGLDENVEDLINLILQERDNLTYPHEHIEKLIKLDMTALAFECASSNLNFNDEVLRAGIRDALLHEYTIGDTLVKAKVLTALRHDRSDPVAKLLQMAMHDESLWVSERAFFILSDGQLKIQMTPRGVIKEFIRFFLEGRIISTFDPVMKSARKSRLIRLFLPFYFALIIASFATIVLVAYVFYSFIEFIVFKLHLAFTVECLSCLASITLASAAIIYCWTQNNYPLLKKFIYVLPLALIVRYIVFNAPSDLIYRAAMMIAGYSFYWLYYRFVQKPNESILSVGPITAFVFGYSTLIPFFNFETIASTVKIEISQNILETADSFGLVTSLVTLILGVPLLLNYIYRQARLMYQLDRHLGRIDDVLTEYSEDEERIEVFREMFKSLSLNWAQKVFLKRISERMTSLLQRPREEKITFLTLLATSVPNSPLRDAIYQSIEDEVGNFSRSIKSSYSGDSVGEKASSITIEEARFVPGVEEARNANNLRSVVRHLQTPMSFNLRQLLVVYFVLILLVALIIGNLPAPLVLFSDDFSSIKPGWQLGEREYKWADSTAVIRDGAYQFSVIFKATHSGEWTPVPTVSERNFRLGFDATLLEASNQESISIGVLFRGTDEFDFYLVRFSDERFTIDVLKDGRWTEVTPWIQNQAIRLDTGVKNHFEVSAQDSVISLSVNGQVILTIEDSMLNEAGGMGLGIYSSEANQTATITIDNVSVFNR